MFNQQSYREPSDFMSTKDWQGGSWLDIWGAAFLDEVKWGSEVEGSESECWVEQAGGGGGSGGSNRLCWSSAVLANQILSWGPASLAMLPFPTLSHVLNTAAIHRTDR